MDLGRLKQIIDWMARSPLSELDIADGEFRVHLVRGANGQPAEATVGEASPVAGHDVLAPTYGVVHLSSDPASLPLISVGQSVAVGQPLCIIEAMKVFNTIEAETAGTLAAILVAEGAEVAAGQPLFRVE